MLAADKLQLQSALKQQATALKEKEFKLHHENFSKLFIFGCVCYSTSTGNALSYSVHVNSFFFLPSPVTVGTQAAVLAGLDITMFIEFNPPEDAMWVCAIFISRLVSFRV